MLGLSMIMHMFNIIYFGFTGSLCSMDVKREFCDVLYLLGCGSACYSHFYVCICYICSFVISPFELDKVNMSYRCMCYAKIEKVKVHV